MKSRSCIAAVTVVMVLTIPTAFRAQDSTQTYNVSPDTSSGSVYV